MKRPLADDSNSPATTTSSAPASTPKPVNVLLLDMADTTWRMFIPTIGLLLIGRRLDVRYDTKPWLMLAGALVGGLIAAWLVKRQLAGGGRAS